jgi:hypothetical protein
MIAGDRLWWPLPKQARYLKEAKAYADFLKRSQPRLDRTALDRAKASLDKTMLDHAAQILRSDSMPVLSHLINGWGAGTFREECFLDSYASFLHRCGPRNYKILQRHSEGDFHPWQSIAYAVMAGVSPDTKIGSNLPSLRSIAAHSLDLGTDDPAELGHFLFSIGPLRFRRGDIKARFGDRIRPLDELVQLAICEHFSGSFAVCRKIHLTEGVCAVASFFPAFRKYRELAQEFLNTQLDMMLLLGTVLWLSSDGRERPHAPLTIKRIQSALAVQNIFENHVFYAGHLLELAAFSRLLGYEVSEVHQLAISYAANWIARRLPAAMLKSDFAECIYQYGHFRRGITLWQALASKKTIAAEWPHQLLSAYTVNLHESAAEEDDDDHHDSHASSLLADFTFVTAAGHEDPTLQGILSKRGVSDNRNMRPVGRFGHFRRFRPNSWPRSLHYEILVKNAQPSVEIHLESEEVAFIGSHLKDNLAEISKAFPGRRVEWDNRWWGKGRGRVRVAYDECPASAQVFDDLEKLIGLTFDGLDKLARTVRF